MPPSARSVRHLELLLERAQTRNIQFKVGKSQFAQRKVKVLGFIDGCGERSVDPGRVEALRNWPEPKGCDDIVPFLAFVNFLREFVPSFHEHSRHLKQYTNMVLTSSTLGRMMLKARLLLGRCAKR